jgi:hypothetical protein
MSKSNTSKTPLKSTSETLLDRGGRPTKYTPEMAERAYELCKAGAINTQLADKLGVHIDTIHEWRKVYPDFKDAIKRGKGEADALVQRSLYERAMGYSHRAVKIFCTKTGEIVEHEYIERFPPDTTAMIFWLKNRQPEEWQDVNKTELSGTITHAVDAPPQETRAEWLERKAKELGVKTLEHKD